MARRAWDEARLQRGGQQLTDELGSVADWANRFDFIVADPAWCLRIGSIGGVQLGFAAGELVSPTPAGDPLLVIHAIYTEPEAREVGIGGALMVAMTDWARSRAATGTDAAVLPGDRAAKNFFESFGLKARLIRVHNRFPPDGGS